jgi:hypothetical protein
MRIVTIVAVALIVGAGAALAVPNAWRVLARGVGTSAYYSYASASVDVDKPKALRIRATGKSLELTGYFSCQLADRKVASGQAVVLSIAAAKSCSVTASASGDDGGRVVVLIEGQR